MKSVTIVLPVYNQAQYLSAALDGVFSQTYRDYELIVVNDGSTDGAGQVLDANSELHDFTVINQTNRGLPTALNVGFSAAKGEYLTWTSADNVMLPDMLSVLVKELDTDPAPGLVYADTYVMDEAGGVLDVHEVPEYDPYLLLHVNLIHCCFLYRRECLETAGGFDPDFKLSEDWEYWVRLSRYFPMKHVRRALYLYRLHGSSLSAELSSKGLGDLNYKRFAVRIRRRYPIPWFIGKFKWWWLRLFDSDHMVIRSRAGWEQAVLGASLD